MALLWKRHKTEPRPVEVECPVPAWPHRDADGDTIYVNSHFTTEEECWEFLRTDILAGIQLSGDAVRRAKADLATACERAGADAEEWSAFVRLRHARRREREASGKDSPA